MITESKLSKQFWNEAILCAVYLSNRSPTNSLIGNNFNKTPAEIWFGTNKIYRN